MTELKTAIVAVTVYGDRARVVRSGEITLEPGSHQLDVLELPLALDSSSVRASARGTARARLLGVNVKRVHYLDTPYAQVRELETQIESLQDQVTVLDTRDTLLKEERVALRQLMGQTEIYARGLAFGKTKAGDQMELLEVVTARAQQLDAALWDTVQQKRDLNKRLQKLTADLGALHSAKGRERYTATVEVEVLQAGSVTLDLTYVVANARWQPLYDIRLCESANSVDGKPSITGETSNTGNGKSMLEVNYLAQVSQSTGESWQDVNLTFSTARPALNEVLPELDPWYVAPFQSSSPSPDVRHRKAVLPAAMLDDSVVMREMAFGLEEAAAPLVEIEQVSATVETSGAAVTYEVPGTVTIPADNEPHKVRVGQLSLEPALDYVAVPKLVAAAYRRAKVTNDSAYTLLPGSVSLFAGEEFIGTTELELIPPGGEIELHLGVDDRVKVHRELLRRDVDKRLLGDERRLRYAYQVQVENLLPVEARVTVYDQIPVAQHEAIKVKFEQSLPKPDEQSDLGIMRWDLTLAPKEQRTIIFDFTVVHPRSMVVQGLP